MKTFLIYIHNESNKIAMVFISALLLLCFSLANSQEVKKQSTDNTQKNDSEKIITIGEKAMQTIEPVVAISPTKMNVLYIGVDNPVDIAVSGCKPEDIKVTISNGIIKKEGNGYNILPKIVGNAVVTVTVNDKIVKVAEFRVKSIPSPIAKVAGKRAGRILKADLLNIKNVEADLESFDFDAKYTIVGFTVSANVNEFRRTAVSNSYKITDEQMAILNSLSVGDKVFFLDISAIGPDGKVRELNSIILTIME